MQDQGYSYFSCTGSWCMCDAIQILPPSPSSSKALSTWWVKGEQTQIPPLGPHSHLTSSTTVAERNCLPGWTSWTNLRHWGGCRKKGVLGHCHPCRERERTKASRVSSVQSQAHESSHKRFCYQKKQQAARCPNLTLTQFKGTNTSQPVVAPSH